MQHTLNKGRAGSSMNAKDSRISEVNKSNPLYQLL